MAVIKGTARRDVLLGTSSSDTILGLNGNDTLRGANGADTIKGGNGVDTINGDNGDDRLYGDAGNDTIRGGNNNDRIYGGADNDKLFGDTGNDTILGGGGADIVSGGDGDDVIGGDAGADTLNGDAGNDTIVATVGADTIDGGTDTLIYNASVRAYEGGDTLSFAGSASGVTFNLAVPGQGVAGIEHMVGSALNDNLLAGLTGGNIFGGAGDDIIQGNGSNPDRVFMRGDDGDDRIVCIGQARIILQYDRGLDRVEFFSTSDDIPVVSKAEFGLASIPAGGLNANEFASLLDPTFSTPELRLVYETDNHILWADKDGSGDVFQPKAVAVFDGLASLSSGNFWVID